MWQYYLCWWWRTEENSYVLILSFWKMIDLIRAHLESREHCPTAISEEAENRDRIIQERLVEEAFVWWNKSPWYIREIHKVLENLIWGKTLPVWTKMPVWRDSMKVKKTKQQQKIILIPQKPTGKKQAYKTTQPNFHEKGRMAQKVEPQARRVGWRATGMVPTC